MTNIEMKLPDLVDTAGREHDEAKPQRKPSFKVHSIYLFSIVRNYKARLPNLGHNLIRYASHIILFVDTERTITRFANTRLKAIRPCRLKLRIDPHCDEPLCRCTPRGAHSLHREYSFRGKPETNAAFGLLDESLVHKDTDQHRKFVSIVRICRAQNTRITVNYIELEISNDNAYFLGDTSKRHA